MTVQVRTDRIVENLQRMVRQPSVSATGEGIEECARLVSDVLNENGVSARLLRVPGRAPVVYGEIVSKRNPDRTVLFYNHYDVQPAEPLDMWNHEPFGGVLEGGRVYGRGASDDKGELAARIEAVRRLEEGGGVPCSVKFAVEGEEESGSGGIPEYIERYGDELSCDGVVWEFGYVDNADRPVVGLGAKGLMLAELRAKGPARDLHSGMAPVIQNAAWRLVGALSTLAGPDGRMLVPHWYDEAVPLSAAEEGLLDAMPYDADSVMRDAGVERFVSGQDAEGAKADLAKAATCNISGMQSGYAGRGAKTVLPARAVAKLDMRLVPGMVPGVQEGRLREHLAANGYGDVELDILHAQPGARTSPDHPFVRAVRGAADGVYGSHILSPIYPETGPVWHFASGLGVPCVLVGGTHVHAGIHSPDEYARVDLLEKTAKTMVGIVRNFSV